MSKTKRKAFTLTELLVVVVVIGVLAAVVLPKYTKVIETRKTTEAENMMAAVRTEQERRCALNKPYAADLTKLAGVLPSAVTKNFSYTLQNTGVGMEAQSLGKYNYKLEMPSYADGRICCSGRDCNKLNKDYPNCNNLTHLADYRESSACAAEIPVQTCEELAGPKPEDERVECNGCGTKTRSAICNETSKQWVWTENWSACSKTAEECASDELIACQELIRSGLTADDLDGYDPDVWCKAQGYARFAFGQTFSLKDVNEGKKSLLDCCKGESSCSNGIVYTPSEVLACCEGGSVPQYDPKKKKLSCEEPCGNSFDGMELAQQKYGQDLQAPLLGETTQSYGIEACGFPYKSVDLTGVYNLGVYYGFESGGSPCNKSFVGVSVTSKCGDDMQEFCRNNPGGLCYDLNGEVKWNKGQEYTVGWNDQIFTTDVGEGMDIVGSSSEVTVRKSTNTSTGITEEGSYPSTSGTTCKPCGGTPTCANPYCNVMSLNAEREFGYKVSEGRNWDNDDIDWKCTDNKSSEYYCPEADRNRQNYDPALDPTLLKPDDSYVETTTYTYNLCGIRHTQRVQGYYCMTDSKPNPDGPCGAMSVGKSGCWVD